MSKLMKQYVLAFLLALGMSQIVSAASTKFTNVTVTGTLTTATNAVTGNQTVTGNSTVSGNASVTGNQTTAGATIKTASATTGVYVSTTVAATSSYAVLTSSSGPLLMTSTPSVNVATATNGQILIIKGVSATNTITFQDEGTLTGSKLELGSTTRVVSDKKVLQLIFDSTLGEWLELSYGNN